jgi:hypothetical protein
VAEFAGENLKLGFGAQFGAKMHLCEERRSAKHLEAAAAAEMRQGGRSTRQRGSRTPARSPGSYGVRTRRQAARARSSPPGAGLGRLRDDVAAAETGNRR